MFEWIIFVKLTNFLFGVEVREGKGRFVCRMIKVCRTANVVVPPPPVAGSHHLTVVVPPPPVAGSHHLRMLE